MSAATSEQAALLALLSEAGLGSIQAVEPLTAGLSGAGVYAVTAERGAYVLRVQSRQLDDDYFAQQLRVLRRASSAGIAPAIVYVDEQARAVVSARVAGLPLAAALAQPEERGKVLASVVDSLRRLHALEPSGVNPREPLPYVQRAWEAGRERPGFPEWAKHLAPTLNELSQVLASDSRRVVSHNDVNPGNFLWDGQKAWLIDWEVSGLGHPYYDLASLAVFLRLDDATSFALAAQHDGAPLDDGARATLLALRRLVGLLAGLTFLGLVEDLTVRPCPTRDDAPSLADCYAAFRAGTWSLHSPYGSASMGLALLALAFD